MINAYNGAVHAQSSDTTNMENLSTQQPPSTVDTDTYQNRPSQQAQDTPTLSCLQIAQAEWAKLFQTRPPIDACNGHRPFLLSSTNQRKNERWGDPMREKESSVMRVYALNLNGLSMDRRGGQFDELCSISKEIQADVICCQEHKVDTTNPVFRSILLHTMRQHWQRSRLVTGTTKQSFTHWYKPGGSMMFSTGNLTDRIVEQQQDFIGGWVTQTFKGQHNAQIIVMSAYQVVTYNTHTGLLTTTAQQRSNLIHCQDPILEPRKAFKRDLRKLLQFLIDREDDILLVGDFNETIDDLNSGMSKIVSDFHLVDLMQGRSGHPFPATYARGKHRLDYGFATQRVADALESAGYEAFNERFPTDHRAYYFDFNVDQLFRNAHARLAPPRRYVC
jgi:exonuclease III